MKKISTLFLTFAFMLSLLACGNAANTPAATTEPASTGLQVGFGRESIMPEDFTKVHIAGGDAANRVAKSIYDNLYITCIAFQEGGQTFLLYTMDAINSSSEVTTPAKAAPEGRPNAPFRPGDAWFLPGCAREKAVRAPVLPGTPAPSGTTAPWEAA